MGPSRAVRPSTTMRGTRIVLDSLWQCLCPSVDAPALLRAVHGVGAPWPPLPQQVRHAPHARRATHSFCGRLPAGVRHVHGNAAARVGRLGVLAPHDDDSGGPPPSGAASPSAASPSAHEHDLAVHRLLCARPPYGRALAAAPTAAIYATLRALQDRPGAFPRIQALARYLLDERGAAPTAALYEALVRANCSVHGAADAVQDVLRALRDGRVEGTPSLLHGALAVLAVHPDYLLRSAVLQEMQRWWVDLAPDGQQSLALGLLRDGQYERALNLLDAMTTDAAAEVAAADVPGSSGGGGCGSSGSSSSSSSAAAAAAAVPPWLLDIYVYVLAQAHFLDDALQIVNHRLLRAGDASGGGGGGGIPLNVWAFLLDACCRRGHYGGLAYVWNRAVRPSGGRPGLVTPSDGMALDVLNMAARHGDADLAAAVMEMLAARGTKLGLPHFEAMLDCYAQAGAVDKALQALCIMQGAGIPPDQGSTRSLYRHLVDAEAAAAANAPGAGGAGGAAAAAALDAAVASLFDLKKQYGSVPIAAFNVVLEAMLAAAAAAAGPARKARAGSAAAPAADAAAAAALDLYRHVRQLCPAGPNRATFRLLFRGCADPLHLHFLVREMRAFGFRPDTDMVDQVVYAHATRGSLDQALQYVYELMGQGEGQGEGQDPAAGGAVAAAAAEEEKQASGEADGGASEAASAARADSLRRQPWISRRTAAALAQRCVAEEDDRIWAVADAGRDRGRPMDAILRDVASRATNRPRAPRNAYGVPHAVDMAEEEAPSPTEATLSG